MKLQLIADYNSLYMLQIKLRYHDSEQQKRLTSFINKNLNEKFSCGSFYICPLKKNMNHNEKEISTS
jgi:hypothetical protein